jgi:hypothetical protein
MKSKDRKRFSHRIDLWDEDGENVLEHVAGVEDFDLAMATYRAGVPALARCRYHDSAGPADSRGQPKAALTLRPDARGG